MSSLKNRTQHIDSVEKAVDKLLELVGKEVVIGMPLGLGKPNQFINALYQRAKVDNTIDLTILTALSLAKPRPKSDLEGRFLNPFLDRVFGDYEELDYALDITAKKLPANVTVKEFFMAPGSRMNNPHAQQNYISSNYTHATRDILDAGINVVGQMVATEERDAGTAYSLSCNPDLSEKLIPLMRAKAAAQGQTVAVVGQVNQQLPFMYRDAEIDEDEFDIVIDNPDYYKKLFSTPKAPISIPDYMIGLNASALVKDGGTLQIGIGALGDAIVYALNMRHQHNDQYRDVLQHLEINTRFASIINSIGGLEPFKVGLYGSTEMLVDGFVELFKTGVMKRKVYDDYGIQKLFNEGKLTGQVTMETLDQLLELGSIKCPLRKRDVRVLQEYGIIRANLSYANKTFTCPIDKTVSGDFQHPDNRQRFQQHVLGEWLTNGIVCHGGFYLGPNSFYDYLRHLGPSQRKQFNMTGVDNVNQLYEGDQYLKREQRREARFINTGIMCTLSGSVCSDGLANGQVVSGVGGQYNFVAMAHALPDGRSIIMIRSTRTKNGVSTSNIVQSYGHITIPRHLRDIVITEYGIAHLRGKTDAEVIQALLNITDSRFQVELLQEAKAAGKIPTDYQIPNEFTNNSPGALAKALKPSKQAGWFPAFPFGTDLTDTELTLAKALKGVAARVEGKKMPLKAMWRAWRTVVPAEAKPFLERMQLMQPAGFKNTLAQRLIVAELADNKAW